MKRKLFLTTFMVALLVCFFAIAVSAAQISEWTEITEVEGMPDKSVFGADGTKGATSRVLMADGATYPAYYICNNSDSLGFKYTDLNNKTGKSYAAKDVVRLEIPKGTVKSPQAVLKTENGYTALVTVSFPEGFTTMGGYTFKATESIPSALVSVSLPNTLTTMGQAEFIRCANLEELIIPEGVTSIPKEFAYYATGLKTLVLPSTLLTIEESAFRSADLSNGIVIPEGCTTIKKYAFKGTNAPSVVVSSTVTSISEDSFSLNSSLTDIYCKCPTLSKNMFATCPNIETVILENTVTIEGYAFCNPNGGRTNISKLVLPEGLTSIGAYAFTRTALTELVLPSTLETVGQNAFITSTSLNKVVVLGPTLGKAMFDGCTSMNELVLTENITTFGSGCLNNVSSKFTTYYTGTDYSRVKEIGGPISTRIKNASYCTYEDYIAGNYTSRDCMFIYDVNLCVAAFDGVHAEPKDDGDCTTAVICTVCAEHTFKPAKQHVSNERITYSSFVEKGEYYIGCTNDGCTHGTTEKMDALFTCLGYSAPENGIGGIAIGYVVNYEAIDSYEKLTGKSITYGVFAVSCEKLGANDILNADGVAADGVIAQDVSKYKLSAFVLKISGFETDVQKATNLCLGAYVIATDEEGKKLSYLQESAPNEGEKYSYVTYNSVVGA